MSQGSGEITRILSKLRRGDRRAEDELVPLVYKDLRKIARRYMSNERADHTLQPTALVNEVFIKLVDQAAVDWRDRAHFFAVTSNLMRQILVDHARARKAKKRLGLFRRVSFSAAQIPALGRSEMVLALSDALDHLEKVDPELYRVAELRAFGGLSVVEVAEVLGVSERTVKRHWDLATAWLYGKLVNDSAQAVAAQTRSNAQ
jgi:RNA polymerase sigma factor (TIGR02999 family)